MSTGSSTQAAFIQGNQRTREHDISHSTQHSALFYLFQEVSKLASPIHNTFLDTNLPSTWLSETSRQGPFIFKQEEQDAYSFEISNSSCQQGLPHMSTYNQMKKVKDECHSSKDKALVEPHRECSPWKVLSLINLQCEKLLHHSDVESDPSSVSLATKLGHSRDKTSTATANLKDEEVGGDCISVECTFRPSFLTCEREETQACISPGKGTRFCSRGAKSYKPECCVKDSKVGCCVQSLTAGKTDTIRPELVEENIPASSQPHPRDKKVDEFSVKRQFEWNQESKKDCFSPKQDILNVLFFENTLSQTTHIPNASINTQLTYNSNLDASIPLLKTELTLDYNANLALTTEPPCDSELQPLSAVLPSSQSASLVFSMKERCHSLSKQGDKIKASQLECPDTPTEENTPPVAQLKSSSYSGETNPSASAASKPEPTPAQQEEIPSPATQQWRTKTPRKQLHPSRSVDIQDPDFQGVTFRMDTQLDDSREQCRLLITSKYR